MYAQQVYHGAPPAHNYAYAPGCVFRRTAPRTPRAQLPQTRRWLRHTLSRARHPRE
jgi:hypothetical protein